MRWLNDVFCHDVHGAGPASQPLNVRLFARDVPHKRGSGEPVRADQPLSAQRKTAVPRWGSAVLVWSAQKANLGGVHIVHTLVLGLGRIGIGLARIAFVSQFSSQGRFCLGSTHLLSQRCLASFRWNPITASWDGITRPAKSGAGQWTSLSRNGGLSGFSGTWGLCVPPSSAAVHSGACRSACRRPSSRPRSSTRASCSSARCSEVTSCPVAVIEARFLR